MIEFEPNLAVDVSLLAIILGLYVTKNDRNLILLLMCCLFAHVSLTSDNNDDDDVVKAESESEPESEAEPEPEPEPNALGAAASGVGAIVSVGDDATTLVQPPDHFKTTLSSGVFDRQLSTPQTNLTSTVFPATSIEANGKLASARGSFFEALVS